MKPNRPQLRNKLRTKVKRSVDQLLTTLATRSGRSVKMIRLVAVLLGPRYWAAVEFRKGNLCEAQRLLGPNNQTRIAMRVRQMLNVLENGYDIHAAGTSEAPFNNRVLMVVHSSWSYDRNGYAVRSNQVIESLIQHGVEVSVFTRLGYPWDLLTHSEKSIVPCSTHGQITFNHTFDPEGGVTRPELDYIAAYAKHIVNTARDKDCNVIHSHSNFLNGLAANKAAAELSCMSVYEMRGLWHLTRASTQNHFRDTDHFKFCERMEIAAALGATVVIAISSQLADWLIARGVDGAKIVVVPNAADTISSPTQFKPRLSEEEIHIGYVGALTGYEGLTILLHAVKLLVLEGHKIRVSIAGTGNAERELHKLTNKLALEANVRFLGRIEGEALRDLFNSLDICPLPRIEHELTTLVPPLKPFEIMQKGIPLIVSDLPPLHDAVGGGTRGRLAKPGCPSSLAEEIKHLIENPENANALARTAHEFVTKTRNWTNNAKIYHSVYNQQVMKFSNQRDEHL